MNTYTLAWTIPDGRMVEHTVEASSKEHALSKAFGNPVVNIWLVEYTMQFPGNPMNVDLFMWTVNGRIG